MATYQKLIRLKSKQTRKGKNEKVSLVRNSIVIISLILSLSSQLTLGQGKTIIERSLDKPVTVTVINGETFVQRDLTDYLNLTLGMNDNPTDNSESDALTDVSVLKEYFMRPHPSVSTIQKYFNQASRESGVPVSLLMVIGQIENNWTQTGPTIDRGWGVMHLVQNNYCNTLGEAAELIGVSDQVLKDDARQNIRGAAALIAEYAGEEKASFNKLDDWFPAIARFSGLINPELREAQARNYFDTLNDGVWAETVWGEEIIIESKKDEIKGRYPNKPNPNLDLIPPSPYGSALLPLSTDYGAALAPLSVDYGPALSNSAASCNYATGRTHSIDTWVNHYIGEGTYLGTISWFQTCPCPAGTCPSSCPATFRGCMGNSPRGASSAHFVIKNSNGEITQMVAVANTAFHAGATGFPLNNPRSIGVEHEATAANPGMWNSAAMLNASATMARYFKNQYGFPTTQNASPGICGHNDMPGTDTPCPGALPWSTWMSYFNGGVTPPANDNCSNANVLTSNTSCSFTSGTVLNATASGLSKPSCDGFPSASNMFDVWYKFTATGSSQTVTVDPSTAIGDPVVSVYSSCTGSPIGCSDLGAGVTETLSLSGLTVGNTYYIRIYDYGNAEPTGSNADFQVCVTGTTGGLPDLTITAGTQSVTPTTVAAGSSVTAACSEDNSGSSAAGANVVSLYLSADSVLTPGSNGDTSLGSIQFPSLAAGSNSLVNSSSVQIPSGTVPGTYYFFFWADGGQVVNEITDGNNFATRQLTITSVPTPTITTSVASLPGFGSVAVGQNSAPQSYTVSGSNLSANISIQAPAGFQISLSSTSGFTSTLTLTRSGSSVPTTTIYGRFSPSSSGAQSGNISHTSTGATTKNVSVSGTGTGGGGGTVQFSSSTYSVNENGGSRTITLTRTGSTNAFVVNYGTSNGTATAGADYTGLNEVMSFAINETSKTFNVPIIDDALVEGSETVNLNLSNPSGGVTLGSPSTAVLTIGDNDSGCSYSISESERTVSPGSNSVNFFMDAPSGCAWTAVSDSPSWLMTSSSGTGDGTIHYTTEVNQSSNSRVGHITTGGQVCTVTQIGVGGAGSVQFNATMYTLGEGGGDATIIVTRTGSGTGSVSYSTSGGTAIAGVDYTSASGLLLFVGNETSKSFNVAILDDIAFEGNESINLILSNPSESLTLGSSSSAILTIIDNESSPTPTPTPTPAGTNFALASNGGVASASSTTPNAGFPGYNFLPATASDGNRKSGVNFWRDDTANAYPDWLQVDLNGTQNITEIDVFTMQDNDQNPSDPTLAMTFIEDGITAFDVQYWTGAAWATVPNGSVTGNNKVWRQFSFSPIATSKVRVLVNNALNSRSRIVELEAWGTASSNSTNHALAANGGLASASSTTPNAGFPGYNFLPATANDGDRKSGVNFWRDDTASAYPDWLQVDFNGTKNITEIDVFTMQDNDQNPSDPTLAMTFLEDGITAFDVQYWTGSAWATVPNGSVTGNNKVWRQFTFSPIATSKVRVLVNNALNARSRIVELEAWGTASSNSTNHALAANGGVASASSTTPNAAFPGYNFLPAMANDGDRKSGVNFWRDDTADAYPDWLQVDFNGTQNITEIDVFTMQDNDQNPSDPTLGMTFIEDGITAFDVQYWTGAAWATVPNGSITGNNKVWRQFTFSAIATSKVRVLVNNALNTRSRIVELEAWGTSSGIPNQALAANGGVASASSTTPNAGFPGYNFLPATANDGDRKSGVNFWRDDTANTYPDWLQVDFNGTKNITEIDVFTMQDNDQSPSDPTLAMTFLEDGITAFDVQYWTGSAWITVPNGSVTGNNKVWRQFTFSPIATSKVRVLVNNALNTRSRIVELEAY